MNFKGKKVDGENLYKAILCLKNEEECKKFFNDVATVNELSAMAQRIEVAQLLDKDLPYTEIMDITGASSTTISRVSKCLNFGDGGYRLILERLGDKEDV